MVRFILSFIAALIVGLTSLPLSFFMLRLRTGEFAIGMWVVAEIFAIFVSLRQRSRTLDWINSKDSRISRGSIRFRRKQQVTDG